MCSGEKLNTEFGVGRMMDIMLNWVVRDKPIDMGKRRSKP